MTPSPVPARARRPATAPALAALAACSLLAAACAPLPASSPGAPGPAAGEGPGRPPVPPGPPWETFTDGVSGISVAMPGTPKLSHFTVDGPNPLDARMLALADGNPATPDYEVTRFAVIDRKMTLTLDRATDALTSSWKRVDRQEKRARNGLATVEIEGIFLDGPAVMSLTAAGGWIYAALVRSSAGLDRDAVERFFDSVRVEVPWRIEVFAGEALTFALPANASALPDPATEGVETRLFSVSGPVELTFSISWFSLDDQRLATASIDQILDDGIRSMGEQEGTRLEKVHTIEHNGLRGRETTSATDDGYKARSRLFVLGHRGYMLSIVSKDAEVLGKTTATRFLDSLRLGAVP